MRRILMTVAIATATLGTVQIAAAQPRPDGPPPACREDDRKCVKEQPREGRREGPSRAEPRHERQADRHEGRAFRPGPGSRLGEAPRGKEYRIIGDKLVLVNKKDHKIVRVIGPAPRD